MKEIIIRTRIYGIEIYIKFLERLKNQYVSCTKHSGIKHFMWKSLNVFEKFCSSDVLTMQKKEIWEYILNVNFKIISYFYQN